MFFDSHTHLNDNLLFPDFHDHIANFYKSGGRGLANIGVDYESSLRAVQIAESYISSEYPDLQVLATIGLHPGYITSHGRNKNDIDTQNDLIRDLYYAKSQYIYAIGEIGTDLHWPVSDLDYELQKYMFDKQCQLARELKLPIVIHSRDDRSGTMNILDNYKDLKIYMHCRGYTPIELRYLLDNFPSDNIYVGFTGNVTYPKALSIKESLSFAYTNNMNILTETDAPYLKPQQVRSLKEPNKPEYILYIYDYMSEFLGIGLIKLQETIKANFENFYTK